MQNKKKVYEKPKLEAIKMLEIGAATCCRTTPSTCSQSKKTGLSKATRGVSAS